MKTGLFNKLLGKIFYSYLEFVIATGKMEIKNKDKISDNYIAGYWHGDSYCMQLVLRYMTMGRKKVDVIITADKRGDYIEQMIRRYGANALRMPDGLKMRHFLHELKEQGNKEARILATALDGPIGPLHEPKKLLFLLASEADKEMVYFHFTYSRVIRLNNRWDKYVIPLPFAKIIIEAESLGKISREDLKNFAEYKKKLKY